MSAAALTAATPLALMPGQSKGQDKNIIQFQGQPGVVQCHGLKRLGMPIELNVRNWTERSARWSNRFIKQLKHIRPDSGQRFQAGKVVGYELTELMTPIDVCFASCDACAGDRMTAADYEHFMLELGMVFALGQVESMLVDTEKWKPFLNFTGTNVFPVISGNGRVYNLLARHFHGSWHLTDSMLGRGRGCNPGTHFIYRNESPAFEGL